MRALLPLAALATLALLAPTAAANHSPWHGINDSWNAMADAMQRTPRDAQESMIEAEEQGAEWGQWSIEESQRGAGNVRDQLAVPF